MKYKIFIILALFVSLNPLYAPPTREDVQAAYTGGATATKLKTLCGKMAGQQAKMNALSSTPQGQQFAQVYGTSLTRACTVPNLTLQEIIDAENAYNAAVAAGNANATNAAATNFFQRTVAYIEAGGSPVIFQDSFDRAYANVMARANAGGGGGGAAHNAMQQLASIQTSVTNVFGPVPAGTQLTAFVRQLTNQVARTVTYLRGRVPKVVLGNSPAGQPYYLRAHGGPGLQNWARQAVMNAGGGGGAAPAAAPAPAAPVVSAAARAALTQNVANVVNAINTHNALVAAQASDQILTRGRALFTQEIPIDINELIFYGVTIDHPNTQDDLRHICADSVGPLFVGLHNSAETLHQTQQSLFTAVRELNANLPVADRIDRDPLNVRITTLGTVAGANNAPVILTDPDGDDVFDVARHQLPPPA